MAEQERTQQENPFGSAVVQARQSGALEAALVQREVAEVQAAMMIARKFPRNPLQAMDLILQDCTRPTLAEAAVYEYARGGTAITGPSIRLAEALAQRWGNISCGVIELSRADGQSECMAYAWDLETGFRDEKRFVVKHWRDTKKGGYAITDERDIYETVSNQGARRKRACILAVIPGDVQEAALKQCDVTLKAKAEVTPERIKSIIDKFGEFGITKEQIEVRIQRHIEAITPALMVQLGRIYTSIKDGMAAAADYFEPIKKEGEEEKATTGAAGLKNVMKSRKNREEEAPPAAEETTGSPTAAGPSAPPSFNDAMEAVKRGFYDLANDIARGLTAEDQGKVRLAVIEAEKESGKK